MEDICFVYKYTSQSNKSYVGMTNDSAVVLSFDPGY
jgi:hypothetical protein